MADDGMLLNFQIPSDNLAPKQVHRGGSWKDRLLARKKSAWARELTEQVQHRRIDSSRSEQQNGASISQTEPPKKRLRVDASHPSKTRNVNSANSHNLLPQSSLSQNGFVSSLFTYNAESQSKTTAQANEDDDPVAASNAPLAEGLDTFTNLGISATIATHLAKKMNVKSPTAIQREAIRKLCESDQDAFIQAQTGSGKTLAYLLPIVQRISQISKSMKASGQDFSRETGLLAIILTPTRELSKQIAAVLETLLTCFPFIICGSVTGGEKKKSEKARLRKGLNILVATPGRLSDHLNHTEVIDVSRVRWLVLDEGDRLMELGFEQDIQKLIGTLNLRATKSHEIVLPGLPSRRNTILCSATIREDLVKLQNLALKEAIIIKTEQAGEESSTDINTFLAPAQLRQSYAIVPAKQRLVTLAAILKQNFKRKGSVMKAIQFVSCADSVDFHFEIFTRSRSSEDVETSLPLPAETAKTHSIPQGQTISDNRTYCVATAFGSRDNEVGVYRLHGSLPQAIRTSTLKAFTASSNPALLICTDVASRGLDLPNIELIIELDPAFSKEEHLHRVGRTARAGNDGRALIFLQPGCEENYIQMLKDTQPRSLTRHDADEMLKKCFSSKDSQSGSNEWQDVATDWQMNIERWVLQSPRRIEQATRAYQSHVRAYATHVAAERNIFDIKQLHLGHLAKAFALREKPSNMKIPGMRPGPAQVSRRHVSKTSESKADVEDGKTASYQEPSAEDEARKKMYRKLRAMNAGASEFNLG